MTAPWDKMPAHEWRAARGWITEGGRAWPDTLMFHDLRWWASQVRSGLVRSIPSSRELAKAWCCSPGRARRVMRDEAGWQDSFFSETNPEPTRAQPQRTTCPPSRAQQQDLTEGLTTDEPAADQKVSTIDHRRGIEQDLTEQDLHTGPSKPGPGSLASLKWTSNTPRTVDRTQLATACLRIAAAITGRPCEAIGAEGAGRDIAPKSAKTLAAPVLSLLRALDWPDLATFEADALLLASAAQRCPEPLFARSLRAEGWPEGTDRSRSVRTLMVQDAWDERVEAARKWAGPTTHGAPSANGTPNGHPTGRQVWDLVCQWFNAGEIGHRAKSGTLGKTPEDHAHRKACIQRVGARNIKTRDQYTERRLRDEFIAAYNGGPA